MSSAHGFTRWTTVVTSKCEGYGPGVRERPRHICILKGNSLFRGCHTSSGSSQRVGHMNKPTRVSRHMVEQLDSTRTLILSYPSWWQVPTALGVCKSLRLFLTHPGHARTLLITKNHTAYKLSIGRMCCHLLKVLSSWALPCHWSGAEHLTHEK